MEIRWVLEEPGDEGMSILGEISLISGNSQIHDECIFLDVWFYHLLLSAQHLMKEDFYLIDELEEPNSLKIEKLDGSCAFLTESKRFRFPPCRILSMN